MCEYWYIERGLWSCPITTDADNHMNQSQLKANTCRLEMQPAQNVGKTSATVIWWKYCGIFQNKKSQTKGFHFRDKFESHSKNRHFEKEINITINLPEESIQYEHSRWLLLCTRQGGSRPPQMIHHLIGIICANYRDIVQLWTPQDSIPHFSRGNKKWIRLFKLYVMHVGQQFEIGTDTCRDWSFIQRTEVRYWGVGSWRKRRPGFTRTKSISE